MQEKSVDVVVIGSGPAGYRAAVLIARQKKSVVLVERSELGGVCTNTGCIPSKAMLYPLELVDVIKNSERTGVTVKGISYDFDSIKERRDKVVKLTQLGIKKLLEDNGVNLIHGEAKLVNKNTVRVKSDSNPLKLKTDKIVIATGSVPISIPKFETDHELIIDSDDFFRLDTLPKTIAILGGGYIGVEFATILSKLGVTVTVIEAKSRILLTEDEEISREAEKSLLRSNVKIMKGTELKEVVKEKNGILLKLTSSNEIDFEISAEKMIVAVGRKPSLSPDELKGVGIDFDEKGIKVDDYLQTSLKNIFAIGDANGLSMLAHAGLRQARVAAKNIQGMKQKYDNSYVPRCIFSVPEIASVGDISNPADLKTYKFPFAANPKARIMAQTSGFVKVYENDKKLVGVSIIGPDASNMISEAVLAIKNRLTVKQLLEAIRPHPTLAEAMTEALSGLED
jgi:dihydrolipoamide dehydrogenase